MKTLAILLGEHPCTVNILFGPMAVHYREVVLYRINYLLIVCVLVVQEQNRQIFRKGGLHLEYGQVTIRIA